MAHQRLIRRYEHNHFTGWVVATKRRGTRHVKYFSDRPGGRAAALRLAQRFRDDLLRRLPPATKVKQTYSLNTTGVIGVALVRERTRTGKPTERYAATWPGPDGTRGKATFSIGRYGKARARSLAIQARQDGLESFYRWRSQHRDV